MGVRTGSPCTVQGSAIHCRVSVVLLRDRGVGWELRLAAPAWHQESVTPAYRELGERQNSKSQSTVATA